MGRYLDVNSWARRDLFEFFRVYTNPYFNICTRVDVTGLLEFLRERQKTSVSLTYQYLALRAANEIEPFRYRLKDDRVFVHDVIHGATIVMKPDESFNFAYFNYQDDFEKFLLDVGRVTQEARRDGASFSPSPNDDLIHFTVLPWISFTSFAHARNQGRADSVPKIAFGKFSKENGRILLPTSVEVHHALMDGLHVGRLLSRL
ncbi:MAG: CatA-like O-acetyltransferase, partial [Pyrinomonadaceae bacterium]